MGTDSQLSDGSVQSLGLALASKLVGRFPLQTAKCVARELRCTVKAAENLLDGHLSARTVTMIIEAFGPGFVAEAVMSAAGTSLITYIRTQADEARASALLHESQANELAQLEAELRARRRAQPEGGVGLDP